MGATEFVGAKESPGQPPRERPSLRGKPRTKEEDGFANDDIDMFRLALSSRVGILKKGEARQPRKL